VSGCGWQYVVRSHLNATLLTLEILLPMYTSQPIMTRNVS
jgi:hypothetical protein